MTAPDTATQRKLPRVLTQRQYGPATYRVVETATAFTCERLEKDAIGEPCWVSLDDDSLTDVRTTGLVIAVAYAELLDNYPALTDRLAAEDRRIAELLEENARLGQAVAAYATPKPPPAVNPEIDADKSRGLSAAEDNIAGQQASALAQKVAPAGSKWWLHPYSCTCAPCTVYRTELEAVRRRRWKAPAVTGGGE